MSRVAAVVVTLVVGAAVVTSCSSGGGSDDFVQTTATGGDAPQVTTEGSDSSLIPPSHTTNTAFGPPNTDPLAAAEAPSAERCADVDGQGGTSDHLDLRVALGATLETGPVRWALVVTNQSEQAVTLEYPSSQDGDVVLKRPDGGVAYRWSADQVFAQQVRCQVIGGRQQYRAELAGVPLGIEPGPYTLVGSLAARPAPAPARLSVTVTAG